MRYVLFESDRAPYTPELYPSAIFDDAEAAKDYARSRVGVAVIWTPQMMGPAYVGDGSGTRLFEIYRLPHNPIPEGKS